MLRTSDALRARRTVPVVGGGGACSAAGLAAGVRRLRVLVGWVETAAGR
jgi:hypothetical protein